MKTIENYIKKYKLPPLSESQELELEKIFTLEEVISMIHHTPGGHGYLVDVLVIIRRDYIEIFNLNYEEYIETPYY